MDDNWRSGKNFIVASFFFAQTPTEISHILSSSTKLITMSIVYARRYRVTKRPGGNDVLVGVVVDGVRVIDLLLCYYLAFEPNDISRPPSLSLLL